MPPPTTASARCSGGDRTRRTPRALRLCRSGCEGLRTLARDPAVDLRRPTGLQPEDPAATSTHASQCGVASAPAGVSVANLAVTLGCGTVLQDHQHVAHQVPAHGGTQSRATA